LLPIILPLIVLFIMKIFGANLLRIYLNYLNKKGVAL
jgi:nucleoside recognition membrane protein YjiH